MTILVRTCVRRAYIATQRQNAQPGPESKEEAATAIHEIAIPDAVAGPMDFTSSTAPAPGVVITPPVGIQWQKGTTYQLEAKVVDNTLLPQAKITADLKPTNT